MHTVTREWLHAHSTERGGYTARQLALLGIRWPATNGWMSRVNGMQITDTAREAFEALGKPVRSVPEHALQIWTDGSCEPNPGPGGWAYTGSDGREAFGGARETTNNRMELTAILNAMRSLESGEQVVIHSDSQYAVNGLTVWRSAWRRHGWRRNGEVIPNRDLWLALEVEMQRIGVIFRWVKGHDGNPGNERADELAGMARVQAAQASAAVHPAGEFEMPKEMFA